MRKAISVPVRLGVRMMCVVALFCITKSIPAFDEAMMRKIGEGVRIFNGKDFSRATFYPGSGGWGGTQASHVAYAGGKGWVFKGCDFTSAIIRTAFTKSVFTKSNFKDAVFQIVAGTKNEECYYTEAVFKGTLFDGAIFFLKCDFQRSAFSGIRGAAAVFEDCNFKGADLGAIGTKCIVDFTRCRIDYKWLSVLSTMPNIKLNDVTWIGQPKVY